MKYFRLGISMTCLIVTLLAAAGPAHAARFIGRDRVSIDNTIHDDLYISGGSIAITGDVDGDLTIVGGNIDVMGDVSGDLFVAGGNVRVEGDVGHTARVTGGDVDFRGRIERDLLAAGGTLVLSKESVVMGDVIAASGTFTAEGSIQGDMKGGFGQADLNGPIGGSVDIGVDRLTVGDQAAIEGDIDYRSSNKAEVAPDASISGKLRRHTPVQQRIQPISKVWSWAWSLASMLIVGLVLAWLFPGSLRRTTETLTRQPWAGLGVGFATLILVPVALIMVMFTIIGIPLAMIGFAAYTVSVYLAHIYGATAIGSFLIERNGQRWVGASAAVGIAMLSVVQMIPVIGPLVSFFLILFALGAMVLAAWAERHPVAAA